MTSFGHVYTRYIEVKLWNSCYGNCLQFLGFSIFFVQTRLNSSKPFVFWENYGYHKLPSRSSEFWLYNWRPFFCTLFFASTAHTAANGFFPLNEFEWKLIFQAVWHQKAFFKELVDESCLKLTWLTDPVDVTNDE